MAKKPYHSHQYDPKTGFIGARVSGFYEDSDPFLRIDNHVLTTDRIPAKHTATHADGTAVAHDTHVESGWSFQLGPDGALQFDDSGNHLIVPPSFPIREPDINMHVLSGMVSAGHVNVKDLSAEIVNDINRSFVKAGLPVLPGTVHIPAPVHTATTLSASVKATLKG